MLEEENQKPVNLVANFQSKFERNSCLVLCQKIAGTLVFFALWATNVFSLIFWFLNHRLTFETRTHCTFLWKGLFVCLFVCLFVYLFVGLFVRLNMNFGKKILSTSSKNETHYIVRENWLVWSCLECRLWTNVVVRKHYHILPIWVGGHEKNGQNLVEEKLLFSFSFRVQA